MGFAFSRSRPLVLTAVRFIFSSFSLSWLSDKTALDGVVERNPEALSRTMEIPSSRVGNKISWDFSR